MTLFDRFKRVRAFAFGIDGVITDGGLWIGDSGGLHHRIHSHDYYALRIAVACNYPIAIVGENLESGIEHLTEELGIPDLFVGKGDKTAAMRDWMAVRNLTAEQVLCMSSDVPDFRIMEDLGGVGTCPADAIGEIRAIAAYVSPSRGGAGAVRDVVEKVMKLQGTWIGIGN